MMSRIRECQRQRVPITNYGLVIAYLSAFSIARLSHFQKPLPPTKKHAKAARAARRYRRASTTTKLV